MSGIRYLIGLLQEEKETRKMLRKEKKKKTKTITNDEGEDVEVTDDDAVSFLLNNWIICDHDIRQLTEDYYLLYICFC